jgi:hypothetical protein
VIEAMSSARAGPPCVACGGKVSAQPVIDLARRAHAIWRGRLRP